MTIEANRSNIRERVAGDRFFSASMDSQFHTLRTRIRKVFSDGRIDVEKCVIIFTKAISQWERELLTSNPLLENEIKILSSELTRKLYKHARNNQILKMSRAFAQFQRDLERRSARVKKTLRDFEERVAVFKKGNGYQSRESVLKFLQEQRLDEGVISQLTEGLDAYDRSYQALVEGVHLIERLANRDIGLRIPDELEELESLVPRMAHRFQRRGVRLEKEVVEQLRNVNRQAAKLHEVVQKARGRQEAALGWMELGKDATDAPRLKQEGIEEWERLKSNPVPRPLFATTSSEVETQLQIARGRIRAFRGIRKQFLLIAELYQRIGSFAPHLKWDASMAKRQQEVEERILFYSTYCAEKKEKIRALRKLERKARAQEKIEKQKSRWQKFCDLISQIFAAIFSRKKTNSA